jgi:fatty acid desaturase
MTTCTVDLVVVEFTNGRYFHHQHHDSPGNGRKPTQPTKCPARQQNFPEARYRNTLASLTLAAVHRPASGKFAKRSYGKPPFNHKQLTPF